MSKRGHRTTRRLSFSLPILRSFRSSLLVRARPHRYVRRASLFPVGAWHWTHCVAAIVLLAIPLFATGCGPGEDDGDGDETGTAQEVPSEAPPEPAGEEPVDIDERDAEGRTALMGAAAAGDVAEVVRLLAEGADPLLTDNGGLTALDLAIGGGFEDVERALLSDGDPLRETFWVSTPDGLRYRAGPTLSSDVLGLLPLGTEVTVTKRSRFQVEIGGVVGRWCEAESADRVGWLFDAYLTDEESEIFGFIEGELGYPSEGGVPEHHVTAVDVNTGRVFSVDTASSTGMVPYRVSVLPGRYALFSIASGISTAYGDDEGIALVDVAQGQTITGIDPTLWGQGITGDDLFEHVRNLRGTWTWNRDGDFEKEKIQICTAEEQASKRLGELHDISAYADNIFLNFKAAVYDHVMGIGSIRYGDGDYTLSLRSPETGDRFDFEVSYEEFDDHAMISVVGDAFARHLERFESRFEQFRVGVPMEFRRTR